MSAFEIRRAGADDLPVVFRLVDALLKELGEEGEEAGAHGQKLIVSMGA